MEANEINQIKLKYDMLTKNVEELQEELQSISVTSFTLNPRAAQLAKKISEINCERLELSKKIVEYNNNNLED